jgi:H+/Cl- antiporter ClcA
MLKWLALAVPAGIVIGSAVALFLWGLDQATRIRWLTDMGGGGIPLLLLFLPVAGIGIGLLYHLFGKSVEGGNNLIMEKIHGSGGGVPARMAPLVLIGTLITHLFGGSAGREGTAVQMGGSISSTIARWLKLNRDDTRTLLMAGVAAGFGAVFGTPLTGAIFAIEVLVIGVLSFDAVIPCLIASIVGDSVTTAWGIRHTHYTLASFVQMGLVQSTPGLSWFLLVKVALAAVTFGLASVVFAELAHTLQRAFKWAVRWPVLRPALGGGLVIALAYLVGPDYLGIGVSADPNQPNQVCILSSFQPGGATCWSWWWKILFTAVTLSSGFKGGEVTPLFFIGAALGNTMARLLHGPVDLFAGLGFVAVFAGATNTPLACTIMGIELFAGGQPELLRSGFVVYLAVACFLAYLVSGHTGIYLSQRLVTAKILPSRLPPDLSLRRAREIQPFVGGHLLAALAVSFGDNHRANPTDGNGGATLAVTLRTQRFQGEVSNNGEMHMSNQQKVSSREIGHLRIYMVPYEKRKGGGIRGLFAKPLYQQIIDSAKADGILSAVAHHTHYGYCGEGVIQSDTKEIPHQTTNLCVELIASRNQLELFCLKNADILKAKIMVYKSMEHWDLNDNDRFE